VVRPHLKTKSEDKRSSDLSKQVVEFKR